MHLGQLTDLFLHSQSWLQAQVPFGHETLVSNAAGFKWDDIEPSKQFKWQECYGDFKYARLQVPMDWQGSTSEANKTVEIAVIKVEATVPVTDPTYGGAIGLNPDADKATAKHFDIIGFDPRGINNTRPLLTCFPNKLEAAIYSLEEEAYGTIGTSDTSFDNAWASKRAIAEGCSKRTAEEGIAKHMSTAPVARDIIEIFERHGEWREKEAQRLLSGNGHLPRTARLKKLSDIAYRPGREMVQYWGFSYGSILGATLSAMFPERVKRAVLDGVADSHDYMAGGWTSNLYDTDLIFVKLAEHCWEGGAKHCAIWHEDGPAVIIENVQKTFATLQSNPIAIPAAIEGSTGPTVVTYNDLRRLFRDIVYRPLTDFPLTAQILHDIAERNGTLLAKRIRDQRPSALGETLSKQCLEAGPYSVECFEGSEPTDATYGIACSDGPGDRLNQTKDEYREYVDQLIAQSMLIGASWATIQLPCTAWHARPAWRYNGNFHNKTAHPMLFASNSLDPVTPLANAFLMASGFPGAGVLHQDSEGHCTYRGLRVCTMKSIRHYFQTGELPGEKGGLKGTSESGDKWEGMGKSCEADRMPFDGYDGRSSIPDLPEGASEADRKLWEAMIGLNRNWA